jgi:hypothetical protein
MPARDSTPPAPQSNTPLLDAIVDRECAKREARLGTVTAYAGLWNTSAEEAEAERWRMALNLALNVEDMRTLLRGGTVPEERLDPLWVRRYRRRA